jgi:hypothetical protein
MMRCKLLVLRSLPVESRPVLSAFSESNWCIIGELFGKGIAPRENDFWLLQ